MRGVSFRGVGTCCVGRWNRRYCFIGFILIVVLSVGGRMGFVIRLISLCCLRLSILFFGFEFFCLKNGYDILYILRVGENEVLVLCLVYGRGFFLFLKR